MRAEDAAAPRLDGLAGNLAVAKGRQGKRCPFRQGIQPSTEPGEYRGKLPRPASLRLRSARSVTKFLGDETLHSMPGWVGRSCGKSATCPPWAQASLARASYGARVTAVTGDHWLAEALGRRC
jgi:hypothetical protein